MDGEKKLCMLFILLIHVDHSHFSNIKPLHQFKYVGI